MISEHRTLEISRESPNSRNNSISKHSGYGSVNTRPITCAHAYHVRTRVYILSYLISVPFFFFVDCRVRVRVSSRVRDIVSFIFFIEFFSFRCTLKDRKLPPGQRCPVGWVMQCSYCAYWVKSHGFESRSACYNFFTFFFHLVFTSFL